MYKKKHANKPVAITGVDLKPATKEEKQQSEDNKDRIAAQIDKDKAEGQPTTSNPTSVKKDGTVTITYAGQYGSNIEVGSFVANVFEDGGTCTVLLTKGSLTVTKETKGTKDVSSTTCPAFVIPRSEFKEAGSWNLKVKYDSPSVSGVSIDKAIEVK